MLKNETMERDKLIEILLNKKGEENNSIDLDTYSRGLIDMYDHLEKCKKLPYIAVKCPECGIGEKDKFRCLKCREDGYSF